MLSFQGKKKVAFLNVGVYLFFLFKKIRPLLTSFCSWAPSGCSGMSAFSQPECWFCAVSSKYQRWPQCQMDCSDNAKGLSRTLPVPGSILFSADLKSQYLLRISNLFSKRLKYTDFTLIKGFPEGFISEVGGAESIPRPELHSPGCQSSLWDQLLPCHMTLTFIYQHLIS